MLPTDFPGSNLEVDKPDNATDEQMMSGVPAWRGTEKSTGFLCYLFAWQPSREDIEAINAGHPIMVKMYADPAVPHTVFTMGKDGEVN